jgi:tetrahydromethanopterin S-methyltransferase subunit F
MATAEFQSHDLWHTTFDATERQQLLAEDRSAFTGVTGILMFVVSAGVLLAVVSVLAILALG